MACHVSATQREAFSFDATMSAEHAMASLAYINSFGVSMWGEMAKASQCGESISAAMQHVCTIGRDDFLLVSPDIVWLNEGNGFENIFEVISNVSWTVE